jgi:hypothetical protein
MRRAKQLLILLTIFSLSGIGITYAASATGNQIQNFFLGNAPLQSANLNQVLALLVGPKGPPGVAGVAGRDGVIGMNGLNGLDGAPGATGPAGASVAVVALQTGDVNCPIGGSKLIAGDGTITYVCNGRPGLPGPRGADGTNGTGGRTTPLDTTTAGQGFINLNTCDTSVRPSLARSFTGTSFAMKSIIIADLSDGCIGKNLKISLTISDTVTVTGHGYVAGDLLSYVVLLNSGKLGNIGDDANTVTIDANTVWTNETSGGTIAHLSDISSSDITTTLGIELYG